MTRLRKAMRQNVTQAVSGNKPSFFLARPLLEFKIKRLLAELPIRVNETRRRQYRFVG
jgi:hypothetical protein